MNTISESSFPLWALLTPVALLVLFGLLVWLKGRPFAQGDVFRASRLSGGNRLLPTQVLITASTVSQFKPRWIGRQEESIHMAHVSSVKISTGMLLSDLLIETSGAHDISAIDPSTTFLGQRLRIPVLLAPIGYALSYVLWDVLLTLTHRRIREENSGSAAD